MTKDNVFHKPYVDERDKNNLEGLLEQLNLPPAVITFVRNHKRAVQAGAAVIVVAVVAWALYDSYRENRIQEARSALAAASVAEEQELLAKLAAVEADYGGTDAARWAAITRAQELAKRGETGEALALYEEIQGTVKKSSPLYPLLTFGIAATSETAGDYEQAAAAFTSLQSMQGFVELGYLGLGRVRERQGDVAAALKVYEEYLASTEAEEGSGQRTLVEEKIARIKASL